LITVELTHNNRDSARVEKKVEQIQNKLQINVRRGIDKVKCVIHNLMAKHLPTGSVVLLLACSP